MIEDHTEINFIMCTFKKSIEGLKTDDSFKKRMKGLITLRLL